MQVPLQHLLQKAPSFLLDMELPLQNLEILIFKRKAPQLLFFIFFYPFFLHGPSIVHRPFQIIDSPRMAFITHRQIFHYYQMHCLILNILSLESEQSQDLDDEGFRILKKIMVKRLCFGDESVSLMRPNCFQQYFVIECSKEKLPTFPTLSIRRIFDHHQIFSKIERQKQINLLSPKDPAIKLRRKDLNLIPKRG
jgi:hypothetical protein